MKVISVCRIYIFLHQYVADLLEEKLENVLRTFVTSPVILDMAVFSTSGVIATPPESSAGAVQPLNTQVHILYGVNTGSPFVIPPELGIKRPVMQAQDLQTDRMSGVTPVFVFAQFISLFFRAHADVDASTVFVVFIVDRSFPACGRKNIASAG